MKILLVEPNYRSTFPPLGLLRISAFFKSIGEDPLFIRGTKPEIQKQCWDKIYISSLFTFELPRTIKTINYYRKSVNDPAHDIVVGGVGATLMPEYIRDRCDCKVIAGPLCYSNMLGFGEDPIERFTPDYQILNTIDKEYSPKDAYFTRVTTGCIRKCPFCAVPIIEPKFGYINSLENQIDAVDRLYGQMHDLVILDNNILAIENVEEVLRSIKKLGFEKNAVRNGRKRFVDFNQGIDIRLINPSIARLLGETAISPVRVAFDSISVEKSYRRGIEMLAKEGIKNFMTYVMFNFKDTPQDFYRRLQINIELSEKYSIRISGFPMRYCPIDDIDRHYVSENWNWRYLRGIQCILNATHGIVSPKKEFFNLSFGESFDKFRTIISMPDDYIIYRSKNESLAHAWLEDYNALTEEEKSVLYNELSRKRLQKNESTEINTKISRVLRYYT